MEDILPISELETKGFLLVPNFLDSKERKVLLWDSAHNTESDDKNFISKNISNQLIDKILVPKINKILNLIREFTNIKIDHCDGGFYADTKYVNFPWHQDHGVCYLHQQGCNYLNFYMIVQKESIENSNITILPFDRLSELAPDQVNNIIGHAAQRFIVKDDTTEVIDDNLNINHYTLPFNIETIAYTPKLSEGDLLILRGDMPHRTQNTLIPRLAATLRFSENNKIYKNELLKTCKFKSDWMADAKGIYDPLFEAFEYYGRDSITITEYHDYSQSLKNHKN